MTFRKKMSLSPFQNTSTLFFTARSRWSHRYNARTKSEEAVFDPPTNLKYFFERILCQSPYSYNNDSTLIYIAPIQKALSTLQ